MDVLSTEGWSAEEITREIAAEEKRWPTLVQDNERIRAWIAAHPERILPPDFVNAALVSNCREDRLNCGRCAFWREVGR
jgi:hypothetical protein